MSTKNVEDFRGVLWDAIAAVKSGEMPLDKARVINDLVKSAIDSGRAEVEFLRDVGRPTGSGFLEKKREQPALPGSR